ncbi:MAG TPA: multiheme c-type cytochrome, partial [Myxococcales bacterium]|nr:multiheme c-type cytochrome [Myxococcales bacterium]
RKQEPNVLFADAGDLLFESASRPSGQLLTQKKLKAQTLAAQEALMGAAARALGPRDLALGGKFAVDSAGPVPLLDAGVAQVQGARATILADAGAIKVGLFAAGFQEDPKATIAARAKELRAQGAKLVVMLAIPRADGAFSAALALLPAAKAAGVDLVVLGHLDDPASDLNRRDVSGPPLLAVEGHGQSLLRVDVHLGEGPLKLAPSREDAQDDLKILHARIARFKSQLEGHPERKAQLSSKIDELTQRRQELANAPLPAPAAGSTWAQVSYVPMGEKLASDPDGQKLVDTYDQAIADINLKEAKLQPESCPPAAAKEAAYVGAGSCASCHDSEAAFWAQTRHAHAYETLVAVKKQFSLDCITCHVTGWQQPGGVCRIDRTAIGSPGIGPRGTGRQDVQCEACHGPGSLHIDDPNGAKMKESVPAAWCMRCHEPANSPKFDDAKYRPYILGPGHGEPLARGEKAAPRAGGPNR